MNAPALHKNARAVQEAARQRGLDVEIAVFPEGTRTAADAAAAIGVEVGQIVKSLIFGVGDPADAEASQEVVLALVSGKNLLDESRLARAADRRGAWRVDAQTVRAHTGYPVGGVPPFGHALPLRAFVDVDLLAYEVVWAAAGTPHHVFPLAPHDLVRLTGAAPAPLAALADTAPGDAAAGGTVAGGTVAGGTAPATGGRA